MSSYNELQLKADALKIMRTEVQDRFKITFAYIFLWIGGLLFFSFPTMVLAQNDTCEGTPYSFDYSSDWLKFKESDVRVIGSDIDVVDVFDEGLADYFHYPEVRGLAQQILDEPSLVNVKKILHRMELAPNCPHTRYDEMGIPEIFPSLREDYGTLMAILLSMNKKWASNDKFIFDAIQSSSNSKVALTMLSRIYLHGLLGKEKNIKAFGNYWARGSGTGNDLSDRTLLWAFQNNVEWKNRKMMLDVTANGCSFIFSMDLPRDETMTKLCNFVSNTSSAQ